MHSSLRLVLLLALITGITSSCNRTVVQSINGNLAYHDDTLAEPVKDLTKLNLSSAPVTPINDPKADLELASLAYNHKIDRIDSLVEHCYNRLNFNGVVLVGDHGRIIYEKAVGTADFATHEQLTDTSIFQLASVSKQFTAMSIMMLKQQGKLDFDDPLEKYFPELPYPGITIRNLLNHTSGLPNYMWLVSDKWKKEYPPYNDEIIDLMAKYHPPVYFKPGKRFMYSNTGYMLLAAIVEKVSGLEFMDFADQNIFTPLHMYDTYVYCSSRTCQYKAHVPGYKPCRRGLYRVGPDPLDGSVGDKGVHSTVEDLYKWDQALYTEKLVRQDILAQAFTRGKLSNGKEIDYGFGFRIVDRDGKHLIYHNGLWNGFRSSIVRDVEDKLTVIVLNHTNSPAKHVVVNGIQSILYANDTQGLSISQDDSDESGD